MNMYVCTHMGKTHTHTARRTVARRKNGADGDINMLLSTHVRTLFRAQPAVAENQLTDGDICEHGEIAENCVVLLLVYGVVRQRLSSVGTVHQHMYRSEPLLSSCRLPKDLPEFLPDVHVLESGKVHQRDRHLQELLVKR